LASSGLFLLVIAPVTYAQGPTKAPAAKPAAKPAAVRTELPDHLVKRAKVSEAMARKTALASVPKGTVTAVELEEEDGNFVYSYDVKVPGKKGVREVWVDAMTGTLVHHEHDDNAEGKEPGEISEC
jgi:uncharacterized membrane protein YkoI